MPACPDPSDAAAMLDEYTLSDGYTDKHERLQCPHCETVFHADDRDRTSVIDQEGESYTTIDEPDPADGPFFCPPCWSELETARLARDFDGSARK